MKDWSILNLLPDPVLVVDKQGIIQFANDEMHRLLDKEPGTLKGTIVEDLVSMEPKEHRKLREQYMQAPQRRPLSDKGLGRFKLRHVSGTDIPVDISLNPFEHEGATYVMATLRDIRKHVEMLERLTLLTAAVDSAACGVLITDRQGKIVWSNPMTTTITGYLQDELIGQHTRIFKSDQHDTDFFKTMWEDLANLKIWQGVVVNRHKSGSNYYEELTLAPIQNTSGAVDYYMAIKQDVSQRVRLEKQLADANKKLQLKLKHAQSDSLRLYREATRDKLSGVYNRSYFEEIIDTEFQRSKRANTPLSLVMIDIDFFKQVNDQYGHDAGDKVICALGEMLGKFSRAYDSVCRYGGEEFVVILPNAKLENAKNTADNWRKNFAKLSFSHADKNSGKDIAFSKTLSAGVAQWDGEEPIRNALKRADEALYIAKNGGRNQVRAIPVSGQ